MTEIRKVTYVLGAGFSYGTEYTVKKGQSELKMPIQNNLFETIFQFHCKTTKDLDPIAKIIRQYFSPHTYRSKRESGANRHSDIKNLSVEEVVTFLEEMIRDGNGQDIDTFRNIETSLRKLTIELIDYLSVTGSPSQNSILKAFCDRVLDTDIVVTFNWDTLLDQAFYRAKKEKWHPAWGYGPTVRKVFEYPSKKDLKIPKKYPSLLKLHGSINWLGVGDRYTISNNFSAKDNFENVIMMPPKMLKREIWGDEPTDIRPNPLCGNWAVHKEKLYPRFCRHSITIN